MEHFTSLLPHQLRRTDQKCLFLWHKIARSDSEGRFLAQSSANMIIIPKLVEYLSRLYSIEFIDSNID